MSDVEGAQDAPVNALNEAEGRSPQNGLVDMKNSEATRTNGAQRSEFDRQRILPIVLKDNERLQRNSTAGYGRPERACEIARSLSNPYHGGPARIMSAAEQ